MHLTKKIYCHQTYVIEQHWIPTWTNLKGGKSLARGSHAGERNVKDETRISEMFQPLLLWLVGWLSIIVNNGHPLTGLLVHMALEQIGWSLFRVKVSLHWSQIRRHVHY